MKRSLFLSKLFVVLITLLGSKINAQTTWTGATNTDWATASNWTAGVPDSADFVTIPDVTNDPIITSAAFAKNVTIETGGLMVVSATFSISIFGVAEAGIFNFSTVQNNGTINVGASAGIVTGISNQGTFQNYGTINLGSASSSIQDGISNGSLFNNNPGGVININWTTSNALYNSSVIPFNNSGNINIGSIDTIGHTGLYNYGFFNNNSGGVINIDRTVQTGLHVIDGSFNNSGAINIGTTEFVGQYGLYNQAGTFNNNAGGVVNVNRSSVYSLWSDNATFTNSGSIFLGSLAGLGLDGIYNFIGTFSNTSTGIIHINRSSDNAIRNYGSGAITNAGAVFIGDIEGGNEYGIRNSYSFTNAPGGQISIDRSTIAAIYASALTFTNQGALTIGAIVPMANLITGNNGTFSNAAAAIVKGTGSIQSNNYTNAGGTLSPGYSPGKMTFTSAESFSNSTMLMEVASGGGLGGTDFDQIVVNGVATLSTTTFLNLNFSYPTVNGATFDILTATSISGTIPTGNVSFTNTGSGNVNSVTVSYPTGKVRVTVSSAPLSLAILNFSAKFVDQKAILDWSTASEKSGCTFEIQHSKHGSDFTTIGSVLSYGNSTTALSYNFAHNQPSAGLNYYRIKQVDLDGTFFYSEIISITTPPPTTNVRLSPNPTTGLVHIDGIGHFDATITVRNIQGQVVHKSVLEDNAIDLSNLEPGLYILQIVFGDQMFFERVVKS